MDNQGLDALAALAAAASPSAFAAGATADVNKKSGVADDLNTCRDMSTQNQSTSTNSVESPLMGLTPQQWQQAIAAAISLSGGGNQNNLSLLGVQPNNSVAALQQQLAMQQQLNYFQYMAQAAAQQRQLSVNPNQGVQPNMVPSPSASTLTPANPIEAVANQAISLAYGSNVLPSHPTFKVSPVTSELISSSISPQTGQTSLNPVTQTNQGHQSSSHHVSVSTAGFCSPSTKPQLLGQNKLAAIAPQPQKQQFPARKNAGSEWSDDDNTDDVEYCNGDKRQMKRIANRRSAQLSRKRKKQFIEELKDENDGLRRKEQILKSIPDLVVVFDSSGKLWFVSESVSRFLDFSSHELEGTSFWNRLCEDSVRLLKAAFMDSLAARQPESETAPLGEGIWELRLLDKDGEHKSVTLNGVVHFAGDRPECVCSIRPQHDTSSKTILPRHNNSNRHETIVSVCTSTEGSCTSSKLHQHYKPSPYVHPQQSVVQASLIKNDHSRSDAVSMSSRAERVSESGCSGSSDSGSGDELNPETVANIC